MTAKELLTPRYEVVSDYPGSPFSAGDIIQYDGIVYGMNEPQKFVRNPERFHHIFRKMNWWEKRKKKDMPRKVICKAIKDDEVHEIQEWDMDLLIGWTDKKNRKCCSLTCFNPEYGYFPVD